MIDITLGTHPTGPAGPAPGGPPPPPVPLPPKATSPDGPDNPLPDPGPHVPRSVGPNEPGAPPSPPPFPPPPKGADDPTCLRCGGYFDKDRPYVARGLHGPCYSKAYYRFEVEQYPRHREAGRLTRQVTRRPVDPVDQRMCHACNIAVRLEVGSVLHGRYEQLRPCNHRADAA